MACIFYPVLRDLSLVQESLPHSNGGGLFEVGDLLEDFRYMASPLTHLVLARIPPEEGLAALAGENVEISTRRAVATDGADFANCLLRILLNFAHLL